MRSAFASILFLLATTALAHGAMVVDSVIPDGPAEACGLLAGDRVVSLDGHKVATIDDLQEVTSVHKPGDTVPLLVERDGETVELSLTFGARPDGGVSIGVRLAISIEPGELTEPTRGETECLAWIDKTYRIEAMSRELELDLQEDYETALTCVRRDTRGMASENAVKYCDNVFKVHCSGLDLVMDIGDAQVNRCGQQLGKSLGLQLEQYKNWKTCAEQKIFDRYSMSGERTDAETCRTTLLEECGTGIDAVVQGGGATPEQKAFVGCCSADALDNCEMIDVGFQRGPCHAQQVCINRLTGEWLHCSVLE